MTAGRKLAIGLTLIALSIAVIAYNGVRQAAVYYLTPTELAGRADLRGAQVRLAGTVIAGSLIISAGHIIGFRIGDGTTAIDVRYEGPLPDLFAEGRDVLVEGRLAGDGTFRATQVITTHPAEYKEKTPGR